MQSVRTDNSTSYPLSNQSQWDAWASFIRMFEPFSWFGTFTFKRDILTYAQEHPTFTTAHYEWQDKTGKYENGTYVREYTKSRWQDAGQYERTGSYVNHVQEKHSDRMYRRWARKLNEEIFGARYRNQGEGLLHIYAIEYQKRGVAHLHSLIKEIPTSVSRIEFEKLWENLHPNNGFANIFPYDPIKGGAGYLAKYILKGGHVDICAPKGYTAALSALLVSTQDNVRKEEPGSATLF